MPYFFRLSEVHTHLDSYLEKTIEQSKSEAQRAIEGGPHYTFLDTRVENIFWVLFSVG